MEIEIFGTKYSIKGDADPSYIQALARYVDRKMKEVCKSTSTISSVKVAILAALNISDELFSLREEYRSKINNINKKTGRLIEIIDKEQNKDNRFKG